MEKGKDGSRSSMYQTVLAMAKKEMDEDAVEIRRLKERLAYLERRIEKAKAVFEAVVARLDLEEGAGEEPPEVETKVAPRIVFTAPDTGTKAPAEAGAEEKPKASDGDITFEEYRRMIQEHLRKRMEKEKSQT
ncbi:MAG TPA: hypothetical protein PK836_01905 [Syntrophales bacterium]|nr:hypothetical protein [Syntrophales bacterium]HOM07343.1 hypothetical protein [Syntrophales bacterium]HON98952.1 hypothetical protein [Syntrophales bacterium]HPC00416.1 hypothetical protein [Syntrophales bacterium]HPQ07019.1 hypothetical protein [Syntrophales bacterium]